MNNSGGVFSRDHSGIRLDGALTERVGGRRDNEPPRVDKPAQVGTARSVSALSDAVAALYLGALTLAVAAHAGVVGVFVWAVVAAAVVYSKAARA